MPAGGRSAEPSCCPARTARPTGSHAHPSTSRNPQEQGPGRRTGQHVRRDPQRLGPLRLRHADQPNISSTRWRTIVNHKRKLDFFESALTPNTFRVDLKHVDFTSKGSVRKLGLGPNQRNVFTGDMADQFVKAAPFRFPGI